MNGNLRVWAAASAAGALVIVGGGFLLGVQPALDAASTDNQATSAALMQQSAVEARLTSLAKVAAHQGELDAQQVQLTKAVPSTLKANSFIRRMNALAALDGVVVNSVTTGDGLAYVPSVGGAAASTTTSAGSAVYGISDPSIKATNFVVIPMSVTAAGTRDALLEFTRDAQSDERLFLVSTYSLAPTSDTGAGWTATLTGSVYAVKR